MRFRDIHLHRRPRSTSLWSDIASRSGGPGSASLASLSHSISRAEGWGGASTFLCPDHPYPPHPTRGGMGRRGFRDGGNTRLESEADVESRCRLALLVLRPDIRPNRYPAFGTPSSPPPLPHGPEWTQARATSRRVRGLTSRV